MSPVVVYVATTEKHFKLFLLSIRYLRMVEPLIEVFLFTDRARYVPAEFSVTEIRIENPQFTWYDKYLGIFHKDLQERNIIYLDCDTIVIRPIKELSSLGLSHFEILARDGMGFNYPEESSFVFEGLSQFNTGVVLIASQARELLHKSFLDSLEEITGVLGFPPGNDQVVFRVAVVKSGLRMCNLSNSWNFMGSVEFVNTDIRVLHFAALHSSMSLKLLPKIVNNCVNAEIGDLLFKWKPIGSKKNKGFKSATLFVILVGQNAHHVLNRIKEILPFKETIKAFRAVILRYPRQGLER